MNPTPASAPDNSFRPNFGTARRVALIGLFVVFAVIAWRLWDQNMLTSSGVVEAAKAHPVLAPLVFVGAYALTMLFMLPTLPFNIGAGFLWGSAFGAVYSLFGSTLGATLAFLFARSAFGQPFARGFNSKLMQRLSANLEHSPWKVVAFVRLNPAMPTSVMNFLLGLTSLRLWTYAWGTFVFSAPLCLVFAYLGQLTGGFMLDGDTGRLVRIVAVSLGFCLFVLAGRYMLKRGSQDQQASETGPTTP